MFIQKLSETEYLISLEKGDMVIESLTKWAKKNEIYAAVFNGIGGTGTIKYGSTRMHGYCRAECTDFEVYEFTSFMGNISRHKEDDSIIKVHGHGTWFDACHNSYGGHIFEMETMIVMEVYVKTFPDVKLWRGKDAHIPHLLKLVK